MHKRKLQYISVDKALYFLVCYVKHFLSKITNWLDMSSVHFVISKMEMLKKYGTGHKTLLNYE